MYNSPDYAVQFGESVEFGLSTEQTVFPFMYTMVPFEHDTWERDKSPRTLPNLIDVGPIVGPGATVDHGVNLDPDMMYKLLWIKYSLYSLTEVEGFATPIYVWYEPIVPIFQEWFDYQMQIPWNLTQELRVTVLFHGPDGRVLYGGKNLDAQANLQGDRLPVFTDSIQGYEYGSGQIKSPYLLPRSSTIMFQFTNTHPTKTFVVGGLIYGMKVRL